MNRFWFVVSLSMFTDARDPWLSPDKLQHFFSSAFVQSMAYGALRTAHVEHGAALVSASLATAAVGVGKEVHDRDIAGDFSYRDLTWDALGAGAVSLLLVKTRR